MQTLWTPTTPLQLDSEGLQPFWEVQKPPKLEGFARTSPLQLDPYSKGHPELISRSLAEYVQRFRRRPHMSACV